MMGHNIYLKGILWKIIPKLSLLPLLSGALQVKKQFFIKKDNHQSECASEGVNDPRIC